MRTARHREAAVLAALLWAGCTARPGPVDHARSAPEPPGVAVLMHGTAFAQHGPRDEAVQLVRDVTARAAHALTDEPPMEPVLQAAAARLDKSVARAARAGARDATCRKKGRAAITAVAEHAEMLLRIQLDATVRAHDATAEERTELAPKAGLDGMLSSMGLDGNNTVYETTLDGTIERTTFPGSTTVVKHRVRWSGRRLGPRDDATPPSVRDALARALGAMPTASPPRWDALARGFVTSGCPVVGTAVADAFAGDEAAKRRVRTAATGALGPIAKREEPSVPTELAAAPPAETAAADPAPADPAPAPVPDTPEPALSCPSLCTLHMVELCNNDRTLWSQHGSRWESSRCGVRRSETFLEDCYRMQWLSGTYEQSCIRPCEESAEGRTRLVAMLRRSGCLRNAS
jgi:hypothetical protein